MMEDPSKDEDQPASAVNTAHTSERTDPSVVVSSTTVPAIEELTTIPTYQPRFSDAMKQKILARQLQVRKHLSGDRPSSDAPTEHLWMHQEVPEEVNDDLWYVTHEALGTGRLTVL